MYLLDSLARSPDVRYYCNYHEQACAPRPKAMRASQWRRGVHRHHRSGRRQCISAIPAAWVDSIPLIVICGQVKRELIADYGKIRQTGPQEGNIVGMARRSPSTRKACAIRMTFATSSNTHCIKPFPDGPGRCCWNCRSMCKVRRSIPKLSLGYTPPFEG